MIDPNNLTGRDRSFDGLADKFERNIYGTSKGRLRHELLQYQLRPWLPEQTVLDVIDVGGGTGEMAQVMLRAGHNVLLNDISEDVLRLARAKLTDSPRVRFHQGDLNSLLDANERAALVICHAVLEWTHQPRKIVHSLAQLIRPGGLLSLSFFNADAALFSNAVYGNFDYIERGLKVKRQVKLNPQNPQRPQEVLQWVSEAGLSVYASAGVRCFHDYLRDRTHQVEKYDELFALEKRLGAIEPYKWLGRYFHIIAKAPES
ncbi:methyltransferase domain-containing protein [Alteromonas oceanisediminis]|uniref:methyltransferase domain-containing protein n=1 Tax=Alteromonas oceanisediminis TaxID=2836180 RepID=UPI001BDA52EC|nr:methyltransferase domain-containing protein [Alteromonas oceanisediminis]MBT0587209.1 methyltransferase domain-containing protein [Alteromonas oceanisediminis]